ncbi:hypothetical protein RB6609 [Rhodopirellula baltica SH 1]|uniref:Uncharacterized protein n=1 Tax=Rhodopirellula baltica (strain DSM 10527 / NCIMB 13988 / SH1) TaxID=243090 RepID=Q7UQ01_RHOBA|nr:hypothetical protein RB6609 [Rhodopirellula baltica SH 1]
MFEAIHPSLPRLTFPVSVSHVHPCPKHPNAPARPAITTQREPNSH